MSLPAPGSVLEPASGGREGPDHSRTVSVAFPTAARKGRLLLSTTATRPAGMLDLASVTLDANEALVIEIPPT